MMNGIKLLTMLLLAQSCQHDLPSNIGNHLDTRRCQLEDYAPSLWTGGSDSCKGVLMDPRLAPHETFHYTQPCFNPLNDNEFCFIKIHTATRARSLCIYNFSTNTVQTIYSGGLIEPTWSVTGWIVFADKLGFYKIKSNGDSLTHLAEGGMMNTEPKISPNGTLFFAVKEKSGGGWNRCVYDMKGRVVQADLPIGTGATWETDSTLLSLCYGNEVWKTNIKTNVSQVHSKLEPSLLTNARYLKINSTNLIFSDYGGIASYAFSGQESMSLCTKKSSNVLCYAHFSVTADTQFVIAETIYMRPKTCTLYGYDRFFHLIDVQHKIEKRLVLPE
jgi:hypothetical protein